MRKIQKGTILYKNDDTTAIYERYTDYFDIKEKNEWFVKYIISKEPPIELITDIEAYYTKVKELNRDHDEFVDKVAKEVLAGLSQQDKDYIFIHPDSTKHHFGLGLGIRNKYIHGKKLYFVVVDPDGLSSEITARLASLIIDNYDYENPYYRQLYDSFFFNHLRRLYYAIKGEYPDDIMAEYADLPDYCEAARKTEKIIKRIIFDSRQFARLCKKYGIRNYQYLSCKSVIDDYNKKNWDIVPYDIVLLTSRHLEPEFRQQMLLLLEAVLDQTPSMSIELPSYVFNQKDSVILAVGAMGKSLKKFPRFNTDDDIIRAAISDNGEAIQYVNKELRDKPEFIHLVLANKYSNALKMRCMSKYRDKEEYVRVALEANGCNIQYASRRLRDDLETAKFAVTHQKNWYPESTVCNLSTRLRDNIEIALLDISEGHACVNSYSKRLRDCDEVAEALIKSDNSWKIYQMSKRIQKKYVDEERIQ